MAPSPASIFVTSLLPSDVEVYGRTSTSAAWSLISSFPSEHVMGVNFQIKVMRNGENITEDVLFDTDADTWLFYRYYDQALNQLNIDNLESDINISLTGIKEQSAPSIGNIPMGELTFNGVQSVTYNGTDYTKLVVDETNYPPLPVTISFTIDGTAYQAEEGMTWKEWITSKYNTSGLKISGSLVLNSSGSKYVADEDQTVATAVNNHSIIIANKSYAYYSGTPEKE